jgi:hypothetical protein
VSRIDIRKREIIPNQQGPDLSCEVWLDMGRSALVEVTSEEEAHPIESANLPSYLMKMKPAVGMRPIPALK